MNEKEIAKQYEENRVKVLPLLEELVEQFKKAKSSLDIQQLQLITEYLICDREFDEIYIDVLEKEIEQLKRLWNTRKEREMEQLIITIIGTMFIVIAYLIGLNQNRKEKMELLREDIQYSANPLSIDNSKYAIEVLEELLEESEK